MAMEEQDSYSPASWQRLLKAFLFGLVLAVCLSVILSFQFLAGRYQWEVAQIATHDVRSAITIPSYVSKNLTARERDLAEAAVLDVYKQDPNVVYQQKRMATNALERITASRGPVASPVSGDLNDLRLSSGLLRDIATLSDSEWVAVTNEVRKVLDVVMRNLIKPSQVEDSRDTVLAQIDLGLSPIQASVATRLVQQFIVPNYLFDAEATAKGRRAARDGVEPVRFSIGKGEIIIRSGDVVKELDLEKLEAIGLRNPTMNWMDLFAALLLMSVVAALLSTHLYLFRPAILSGQRSLLLLLLIMVLPVLTAKLVVPGREDFAYLFPIAAAPMLATILLDAELGIMVAGLSAVLMGVVSNGSFELAVASFLMGLIGVVGLTRTERFSRFFLTGIAVGAAVLLVVASFEVASGQPELSRLVRIVMISLANGMLSAALTLGTVWLLGHLFGITTTIGLLELGNQTQPLLRRLFLEAPGTYQHSMLVADLASQAAHEIGADALLSRVASYYHDIGKITSPHLFIENQIEGHNIHDQLDPNVSAQNIIAHVREGLSVAKRNRLPVRIQEAIAQHHGTALAAYFYERARKNSGDSFLPEDGFRYPGPRPRSKEAAIIMLADKVEAWVRSSRDHSHENIARLVDKIINEKLFGGQLADCDLTLRDIEILRQTFTKVLRGIYHPRIEYPEAPATEPDPVLVAEGQSADA